MKGEDAGVDVSGIMFNYTISPSKPSYILGVTASTDFFN
jgi:hypothetical protein